MNPGTSINEIGVAMQGSNGLLSNLDLINIITKGRMKKRKKCQVVDVTRIQKKKYMKLKFTTRLEKWLQKYLPSFMLEALGKRHYQQPVWMETILGPIFLNYFFLTLLPLKNIYILVFNLTYIYEL